jgi:hypothetical protein
MRLGKIVACLLATLGVCACLLAMPVATEAVTSPTAGFVGTRTLATVAASGEEAVSLEAAAAKAGETGRKIAMSLIGLGFAIASIVLAFRRDFKEAAGIFAVGFVAILLATPQGVNVLHDTVNTLFGSSS